MPITIARLTAATAGCMLACSASSVADQPSAHAAAMPDARPRVGLVLAGGGAKGGAHVCVLKVLEELNVPIDCIAGTSMGALVRGAGRRELQTIQQKPAGTIYSNEFELGLKDGYVLLPAGIVNTSNIEDLLRTYVPRSRAQTDFDQLPIPYRAVATDMLTGSMVCSAAATSPRACAPAWRSPVHLRRWRPTSKSCLTAAWSATSRWTSRATFARTSSSW